MTTLSYKRVLILTAGMQPLLIGCDAPNRVFLSAIGGVCFHSYYGGTGVCLSGNESPGHEKSR